MACHMFLQGFVSLQTITLEHKAVYYRENGLCLTWLHPRCLVSKGQLEMTRRPSRILAAQRLNLQFPLESPRFLRLR
jgi:hypothetical protein